MEYNRDLLKSWHGDQELLDYFENSGLMEDDADFEKFRAVNEKYYEKNKETHYLL